MVRSMLVSGAVLIVADRALRSIVPSTAKDVNR
jgi:hypothetical protein